MTIYCRVTDGVVADRISFDGAMPEDWPDRADWIASDEAQIGWSYADGMFVAPVAPPVDVDVLWVALRAERDRLLDACDKLVLRYRNQLDASLPTTWTIERYQAELIYMQALRDLPGETTDPAAPVWPEAPV